MTSRNISLLYKSWKCHVIWQNIFVIMFVGIITIFPHVCIEHMTHTHTYNKCVCVYIIFNIYFGKNTIFGHLSLPRGPFWSLKFKKDLCSPLCFQTKSVKSFSSNSTNDIYFCTCGILCVYHQIPRITLFFKFKQLIKQMEQC